MDDINYKDLINGLNQITLTQFDLMEEVLKHSELFTKRLNENAINLFDELFKNEKFIEQSCVSARESIILGTAAIFLSEEIDFNQLVKNCVNKDLLNFNISELENIKKKIAKEFFFSISCELFTKITSANKSILKEANIKKKMVEQRTWIFVDYIKE